MNSYSNPDPNSLYAQGGEQQKYIIKKRKEYERDQREWEQWARGGFTSWFTGDNEEDYYG